MIKTLSPTHGIIVHSCFHVGLQFIQQHNLTLGDSYPILQGIVLGFTALPQEDTLQKQKRKGGGVVTPHRYSIPELGRLRQKDCHEF